MEKLIPLLLLVLVAGCVQTQQPAPPKVAQAQGNTITIKNFAFEPPSLSIQTGTTVTWINQDSAPHTIASEKFASGTLREGQSFQFTFTESGTYGYSCGIHPSMKGTITVG